MKKIVVFVVLSMLCLFTFGCKKIDFSDNVSQIRYDVLKAENEDYVVTCYLETREHPFILDGEAGDLENLTIIKLQPKTEIHGEFTVSFMTDKEYSKSFTFEPSFNSFISSIPVEKMPENNLTVTITNETGSKNLELTSVKPADVITHEKALNSVYTQNKEKFDWLNENDQCFEICVRLICEEGAFWFIGLTTISETTCYLVDGKTGKIIAEKKMGNS